MPPEEYASVRALKEKRMIENVEQGIVKPDHIHHLAERYRRPPAAGRIRRCHHL